MAAELLPVALQADDTYKQLKKDLEYLDLKVSLDLSRRCPAAVPPA